jgi:hypothetical protein
MAAQLSRRVRTLCPGNGTCDRLDQHEVTVSPRLLGKSSGSENFRAANLQKGTTLAEAEKSINRQIAEKLGYHVYHYDKDVPERCYYQLWDAEGDPVALRTRPGSESRRNGERETEAEAWEDCPDWQGDIKWAVELLETRGFTIERNAGNRTISVIINPEGKGSAESLSEAIAIAFLTVDTERERKLRRIEELQAQKQQIENELAELEGK